MELEEEDVQKDKSMQKICFRKKTDKRCLLILDFVI